MDNELIWHDASTMPPHGCPVIAEFHLFNSPKNPLHQQVVWHWEGEWRPYPETDGRAWVNRWRELPATQGTADNARIEALESAVKLAAVWFDEYALLHRAKGTADGNDKGQRNQDRADRLRAILEGKAS
jgi:hypothetical protein